MQLSYTIYSYGPRAPTVGIAFPPTPSLTATELQLLIDELIKIKQEMGHKPTPAGAG